MNPMVQIFILALVAGSSLAGGKRYNRGVEVLHSAPVYAKTLSSPVAYDAPAAVGYAAYATPTHLHAPAAPTHYHAAPPHYHAAPPHYHAAPAHYHAPALTYAQPAAQVALLSTAGKPQVYGKSIPAAAIRNIETVMVTKTITPVVTKTTTHHTAAEPALSVGHVQGYQQAAVGHARVAPVQFQTAYTSYSNPTIGVSGPVLYSGSAVGVAPVAAAVEAVPEPVTKTVAAAVYKQPAYAQYAVAAPAVYKSAVVAEAPAVYKTAIAASPAALSVVPGAGLSYETYGLDAHSVPVSNFLELRSGNAVLSGYHK